MKKTVLISLVSLLAARSFAGTITCAVGESGKSESIIKTLDIEALKKSPIDGVLLEKDGIKFMLTISDIYIAEKDGTKTVLSKYAMTLSQLTDVKHLTSSVSDGQNLILFDADKNISIMCKKN